jgi:site-specific DNA recombinase
VIVDGYVRVSQVGRRAGERFISPSVQREQIEGWAKGHGALIARMFVELDESGGRRDRPLLMEAVERVERGQSQGLVVAYLSRFGRSHLDGLLTIDRITKAGGVFVSVEEDLDFSSDIGRHMLRSMLSWAEWELDRMRTSWTVARERAVARGVYLGARPFGYRPGADGRLQIVPSEGPLVTELFRRRAAGAALAELERFMREAGAVTSKDKPWRATGIRRTLEKRIYPR